MIASSRGQLVLATQGKMGSSVRPPAILQLLAHPLPCVELERSPMEHVKQIPVTDGN